MKTELTLNEILYGDNKLIIPDLQRDYCWAEHGLISPFISGLIEQFNNPESRGKKLNMGLLYWYKGLHGYWQLCDGQQRITTLFLCLGILNRMCEDNPFSDLLISPFELKEDDKEPRLQYAIRESSLYFMSDLVCKFFLDKTISSASEISSQPWFLSEYQYDPSISNYLMALQEIEKLVSDIDPRGFGSYLSTQLEFHCHDMGSRKDGEETFVVINTTGEPLTPTENLKPHIIQENSDVEDIAEKWEKLDHYFWKHRGKNETSDPGLNEFLRLVSLLHAYEVGNKILFFSVLKSEQPLSFDYKQIRFSEIESDMMAYITYRLITPICDSEAAKRGLRDPDSNQPFSLLSLFTILPTLLFIKNHPSAETCEITRVHHLFSNIARYQSIGSDESVLSPWNTLELISSLKGSNDIADLVAEESLDEPRKPQAVFPYEERLKLFILKKIDPLLRDRFEKAFAKAEDYWLFNGEICSIISYSRKNEIFDIVLFEKMFKNAKLLWDSDGHNELRCALLTLNLTNYPLEYSGQTKSLGYSKSNWKEIYSKNHTADSLMSFIANVPEGSDALSYLKSVCESFDNEGSTVYPLVKNREYIDYCSDKFITIGDHIILLNPKIRAAGWIYLFDGQIVRYPENNRFGRCRIWEKKILYTDHEKFDIGIDLVYEGPCSYRIYVFERNEGRPKYPGLYDEVTKLGFSIVDMNNLKLTYASTSISDILDMYYEIRGIACL